MEPILIFAYIAIGILFAIYGRINAIKTKMNLFEWIFLILIWPLVIVAFVIGLLIEVEV